MKAENYEKKALNFLKQTNTIFKCRFIKHGPYFIDEKDSRDIYKITLQRGEKKISFNFGQSINDSWPNRVAPIPYDVLACLTKNDPESFEEFCNEFGYDTDSRKAEKIYKAVVKEYIKVSSIYSQSELEQMAEIQ